MSRLKAHANSAKHITFIMKTGYTTSGATANRTAITMNATRCEFAGAAVPPAGVDAAFEVAADVAAWFISASRTGRPA
jgi:hypothetical protein